jgi:3-oxoacyl-[acyl-carrier-protein] synthase-3
MNGKAVYSTATQVVPENIKELLEYTDTAIEDIKYMIPHQPSIGILKEIARKIKMPFEKVKTNMDKYANTSGGTIPIVLDEVMKEDDLQPGDLLLFAAVGAGWTWGSALYKY